MSMLPAMRVATGPLSVRARNTSGALGYPTPSYLHIPVVTDAAGEKLSKQTGASAIDPASGPRLLRQALAFLGHASPASGDAGEILAAAAREYVTKERGQRGL